MPLQQKVDRDERFITWLSDLRDSEDRATLAALRRGLGRTPGTAIEMYQHVTRFLSESDSDWNMRCYFLVASLFALHPEAGGTGSMGSVLSRVRVQTGSESVEKRFVALLNSHKDDLDKHLRHAVSLAGSKEVPIDWAQLLRHLRNWSSVDGWVQRQWARDFWSGSAGSEQSSQGEED